MRPIERGDVPKDSNNNSISFRDYRKAKSYLVEKLGCYCSYCEKRITQLAEVEHILPKSDPAYSHLVLEWSNFLLSCKTCNTIKGNKKIKLEDYFWVDRDNTFRAFQYSIDSGTMAPHPNLSENETLKANKTLEMLGLDRTKGHPKLTPEDKRWIERIDAIGVAKASLKILDENDTPEVRELITKCAEAQGFWSVWMTVFQEDQDMLRRLIEAFPGTCRSCFDSEGKPIPRPGGAL